MSEKTLLVERGWCFLSVEKNDGNIAIDVHPMGALANLQLAINSHPDDQIRNKMVINVEEVLGIREPRIGVTRRVVISPDLELSLYQATKPKVVTYPTRTITQRYWMQITWRYNAPDNSIHQCNEANIFLTKEEVEMFLSILKGD